MRTQFIASDIGISSTREQIDDRASRALSLVENLRVAEALNLYKDDDEKPLPRRVIIPHHSTPFPLPPSAVYSRPLKIKEAELLLKAAKIEFNKITSTYIAPGIIDRDTARILYPKAQCVVAELPAEIVGTDGKVEKTTANAHMLFVWGKRGWKIAKVMLENIF